MLDPTERSGEKLNEAIKAMENEVEMLVRNEFEMKDRITILEGRSIMPEISQLKEIQERKEAMQKQTVDSSKLAPWSEAHRDDGGIQVGTVKPHPNSLLLELWYDGRGWMTRVKSRDGGMLEPYGADTANQRDDAGGAGS